MSVNVRLFGFGDERPACFNGKNRLQLDIETPASARRILHAAGIEEAPDLVLMDSDRVIPPAEWDDERIGDQSTLVIMSAIEGG